MTEKTYKSLPALACAEQGNLLRADILETAANVYDELVPIERDLQQTYWALHARILKESFDDKDEQLAALKKLGQLAIALESLRTTRSVVNVARGR